NPTALNADERALIERHPVLGQELTAFGNGLEEVGLLIRVHHERVDGTGYPDRLTGDNIPWLGRLLAVAVAFAASKLVFTDAVEEIKRQADAAFDPNAVRAFLRALPRVQPMRPEREILLSELRPGMVLAHGIYSAAGLLLAPEGQPLNPNGIEKLLNYDRIQPINQSLVVYC
ncbi:MAG TPA: HD domain-containing phosphohydrolase, partial [Verrucomicrobiae bacterium]|nr:HD domain-containing phosphohydrolase [Verrucomicrobiae bacterium]